VTLELNRIYCGDCLELMREMPDKSVDLVLTDPPYSTPVAISFGRQVVRSLGDLSIQATYVKLLAAEWKRILKPDGKVMCFCDDTYYPVLFTAFYEWPFRQMVVWDKGRIGLGTGFRRQHELIIYASPETGNDLNLWAGVTSHASVLKFSPVPSEKRVHGAQKPVDLLQYLIRAATHEGDVILDPFFGSGSTGEAAITTQRNFIGIEITPEYVKIAEKRLEKVNNHRLTDFGELVSA